MYLIPSYMADWILLPKKYKSKRANLEADGAAVVELAGGAVVLAHAAHQLVRVVLHTGGPHSQKKLLTRCQRRSKRKREEARR